MTYPPDSSGRRKYSFSLSDLNLKNGGGGSCRNLCSFSVSFGLAALVMSTLNVYITSQVTSLQKQYGLSSTAVGAILSCNDLGFLATVLFVSHLGHTAHIPRLLALACALFALSGVVSGLTYFINPTTLPAPAPFLSTNASSPHGQGASRLCLAGEGARGRECGGEGEGEERGLDTVVLVFLGLSMVLQGVAKAPRVSLSTTYVDDNTPDKTRTSLYIGFIMTLTLFGPAVAIFVGGLFQRLPVDLKETALVPGHPDWIGCWWLGFLVFGLLALVATAPLLLFPRSMRPQPPRPDSFTPVSPDLSAEVKVTEVEVASSRAQNVNTSTGKVTDGEPSDEARSEDERSPRTTTPDSLCKRLKGLPLSLVRVLRQPVYSLTLFGIVALQFSVSGEVSFGPKYVQHQFQLSASDTNLIMGVQKLIGVTVGTFLGGLVTSRLRLTRDGCLRFLLLVVGLALAIKNLNFYFGCPNPDIWGLHGQARELAVDDGVVRCDCSSSPFFPVCGDNSTTFFSPCFAACTNQTSQGFSSCQLTETGEVTPGLCPSDCPWLYYFVTADMISSLVTTLGIMPAFITLIRSVEEQDRSIAMGLLTFLSSLLGFLPGPVIFGGLLDSTCLVWKETCGKRGACLHYDIVSQRFRFKGLVVGLFALAFLLLLLALVAASRQQGGSKIAASRLQTESAKAAVSKDEALTEA